MGTRNNLKFPFLRELLVMLVACETCLSVNGMDRLTTEYAYNNRSWLTELKGELFSEALHYQEKDYGKKLYSGKISSMDWKERENAYVNTYDLDYDQLGRLTSAKYNNRRYYNSVYYQYDKMGNVTSLTRSGERDNNHYGTIDILGYSYDGNQVVKVSDKESGPHFKGAFHFVDGANEDGELGQILFNGGYVTFKDGKPQCHFYLQDHLGNNRIVADSRGNIEQINTYYPFGALIQDGFSEDITSTQRYKYNGKELDRMFGIDSYDYGARMYDPCMIRWRSLDPLCEKYYSISPYAYCANDPINAIDKGGYFILPSILEKINKRGHAVPIEYMSYIKYITAMNKFGETSYGRNFLLNSYQQG